MPDPYAKQPAFGLAVRTSFAIAPIILCAVIAFVFYSFFTDGVALPMLLYFAGIVTILAAIAYSAMAHVLSEGKLLGWAALGTASVSRAVTFLLLCLLLAVLLRLGSYVAAQVSDRLGGAESMHLRLMITVGIPIILVSIVATLFPAVVDDGDTSLRAALARKSGPPVAWRLCLALVVTGVMVMAMIFVMALWTTQDQTGTGTSAALSALFGLIMAFGTVLASVIVTKAYLGCYR